MMDYKELIDILRYTASEGDVCRECPQCIEAADAIETLLAERDALMNDLEGRCDVCKNRSVCLFDEKRRSGCVNRSHWQWRGPQKGEK